MENLGDSIIIGKGTGLSTFLSDNLGIKSIKSKDLIGLDLSPYKTIIYTSIDPSSYYKKKEISYQRKFIFVRLVVWIWIFLNKPILDYYFIIL